MWLLSSISTASHSMPFSRRSFCPIRVCMDTCRVSRRPFRSSLLTIFVRPCAKRFSSLNGRSSLRRHQHEMAENVGIRRTRPLMSGPIGPSELQAADKTKARCVRIACGRRFKQGLQSKGRFGSNIPGDSKLHDCEEQSIGNLLTTISGSTPRLGLFDNLRLIDFLDDY